MKGKIAFLAGGAVGYVLGARAGRQRYEQIKRSASNAWQSPPVQDRVGQATDLAKDAAATAAVKAADVAKDAASTAADKAKQTVSRDSAPS